MGFQSFSSFEAKRRPDQHASKLNSMRQQMQSQQYQLVVRSQDGNTIIVVGQQPKPNHGQFGIVKYQVKGDSLVEIGRLM